MRVATKLKVMYYVCGIFLTALLIAAILRMQMAKRDLQEFNLVLSVFKTAEQLDFLTTEYLSRPNSRVIKQWQTCHSRLTKDLNSLRLDRPGDSFIAQEMQRYLDILHIQFLRSRGRGSGVEKLAQKKEQSRLSAAQMLLHVRYIIMLSQKMNQNCFERYIAGVDVLWKWIYIVLGLMVLFFLIFIYLNYRLMQRPLWKLQGTAKRLADGDFSDSVFFDNSGEMVEIGDMLNKMVRNLKDSKIEMEIAVRERSKELNCLYELSRMIYDDNITVEEIFRRLPDLLVESFLYPESACAKVTWENRIFTSTNYKRYEHRMKSVIKVQYRRIGKLEVGYPQEMFEDGADPFLKEERTLLRGMSELLGKLLEHYESITELQKREAEYRKLLETLPQGIFFKDVHGVYKVVNNTLVDDIGIPMKKLLGKTDYDIYPAESAELYRKRDKEVMDSLSCVEYEDFHYVKGMKVPTYTIKTPFYDEKGALAGVIGIYWNVTAQKEAQKKLLDTMHKLEISNQNLEHFAYVASHDLKQPLQVISKYLKQAENCCKDSTDPQTAEGLGVAAKEAQRLEKLVQALLEYSRIDSRGQNWKVVNMKEVLLEVMVGMQLVIEEKQAKISYDNLPEVCGDPIMFYQLFQNLIGNALKFTEDRIPEINISCREDKQEWIFSVKDNGIGIEPEDLDKIFVIFKRLYSQDKYTGTGIGLALCKKIVERHNGRIWVESVLGQGSEFFFALPKKQPENEA